MANSRTKEIFKVTKTEDNGTDTKVVEFAVVSPGPQNGRNAQKVYNAAFAEALSSGGLLRQRVGTYMREQGLWNDKKEEEQQELVNQLNELELTLQKGGIRLTAAREMAIDMRRTRAKLRDLIAEKNELDAATAEGQAENARFNALIAQCLVYNDTGEPVYTNVDDYLENSNSEEAFTGAQALAGMLFQLDKNHEATLPENKFLQHWKFVDEQLRLINKDKHLVDTDGKLINDVGHYVDERGNLIDVDGNAVDKAGRYSVEQSPFLDESDQPLSDGDEVVGEMDAVAAILEGEVGDEATSE